MAHSNPTVTAGTTTSSAELDNACGDSSSHGGGAPFGQKNGAEATVMDPCGGARGETWWLTGSCRGVAGGSREVGPVLGATNRRRVVAGTVGEDRTMATLMGLPRLVPVR